MAAGFFSLEAVQDAEGRVTAYEYDALLRLRAVHAPEGATTRYEYDGVGNLVAETDPEGRVTRYVYNALDRLEQRIQNFIPGGPQNADTNVTTRYEYDPAGNLKKVTDPNGTVTCYEYDDLNRLTAEIRNCRPDEPPGPDVNVTTRYEYDPNGNPIRRINPRGAVTRYAYDAANRLIAVTDALSQTTAYAYDLDNHLLAVMDAAGKVTRYEYDLLGRRTAEIRNFREGEPPSPDVNVTTRYEYDPAGNLTRMIDPNGIPTCYEYDALNRRTAEIRNCRPGEPAGPDVNVTTRYEYDRVGNLVRLTDPNGHATRFVYDGLNRLVARTDPEGHTVTFAYDRVGNLLRQVDARGYPTAYAYDALNRLITVTDALSGTTVYRYDPAGNLLALTDANGHTTRYAYDGLYRLAAITDPEGFTTRYEYDPSGNRTAIVDANGHRTEFTYDPLDRLEAVTNAEGETTRYRYDPVGNQTDLIEPDGVVTHYEYDGLYRLAAVTLNHRPGLPADHQTSVVYRYEYDPRGNLVRVHLPPNAASATRSLTYTYDALGRLIAEGDPLGNTDRYAYDPAGNRIRRADPNGHVTVYAYNADNLLVRIAYDDGTAVAFAYDENHNRTVMTDTLGVSRWVYDPLNRVVAVTDSLGRALGYAYDAVGNRIAITYPVTGTVTYAYYANNRLRGVTDPDGHTTRYERDGVGNLIRQLNPNGTVTEAAYDRANRLVSLATRRPDGAVIAAFEYEVNEVGLRTAMTATYGWRNPPTLMERYTYDPLRRLTGVEDSEGFQALYEYDAAGNRTRWRANDDPTTQRPRDGFEVTYTYDAADRLLEAVRVSGPPQQTQRFVYAYDANGNRVNLNWPGPPGPNTQGMDYTYDREDRLITAQAYQTNPRGHRVDREVTRLVYDGLGRRLAKEYDPKDGGGGVKRTEYVLDGLDPVAEYEMWNGQWRAYYRGGVEAFSPVPMLLAMRRFPEGTEGQTYWYHLDGRGSVAGLTKHLGQSTHNYRYDAYGQVLPAQGNFTDPHNHYTFLGKEWDEHLGLYEFGARLYDPWAGVWLTREPLPGDAWRPRMWHRYAYAFANPIRYYDPYGQQTCSVDILTGKQECFGDITGMGRTMTLPSAAIPLPPLPTRWPQGATQPQCYLRAARPLTPAQEHWSEALMVFGSLGGRLPPDFVLSPDTGVLLIYGYPGYLRRRQELVIGRGEVRWGWGEAAAEYRHVEIFQSLFGSEVLKAYEEWAASGGVGSAVPVVGKLSLGVEWSQHGGLNPQVAGEILGGELSLQPGAVMLGWTSEDMTGLGQGARMGAEYQLPHREFLLTSWEVVGELGLQGIQKRYATEGAILEGMVLESGYYRGSERVSGVEVLEWKLARIWQLPYRRVP